MGDGKRLLVRCSRRSTGSQQQITLQSRNTSKGRQLCASCLLDSTVGSVYYFCFAMDTICKDEAAKKKEDDFSDLPLFQAKEHAAKVCGKKIEMSQENPFSSCPLTISKPSTKLLLRMLPCESFCSFFQESFVDYRRTMKTCLTLELVRHLFAAKNKKDLQDRRYMSQSPCATGFAIFIARITQR